ncbi:hypothetical protein M2169_003940 [Streptomyces sp. MJP52]|nr:hypothetical protein [Streptomyces sp. MJP52]
MARDCLRVRVHEYEGRGLPVAADHRGALQGHAPPPPRQNT